MEDKPHIRTVIAGNVKKYRKLWKLTQENLAELADVSNTYIANIECGKTWISDKTLEKIAKALHVDEYLLLIPDEVSTNTDIVKKRQEMIEFLKERENELNAYVTDFFSDTFDKIFEKNIPK